MYGVLHQAPDALAYGLGKGKNFLDAANVNDSFRSSKRVITEKTQVVITR